MPDLFSGIERSHKAGLRPGKCHCSFPLEAFPLPGSTIWPKLEWAATGHTVRCVFDTPRIWRFWLDRILPTKLRALSNALDVTTAERARAPPQPLLMVAKCSVIMGGQLVSRRRLFGCSGPKSGSAGSSWRPQLTQISAAPQTMTPVLQDKPRHSTDLAELCSLILWSALFPFRS